MENRMKPDIKLLNEIYLSSKNQEVILHRITRFIEETFLTGGELNYWEIGVDRFPDNYRIFYKVNGFLNYMELENFQVKPIPEFETVFGKEFEKSLIKSQMACDNKRFELSKKFRTDNHAGKILIEWAKENLKE